MNSISHHCSNHEVIEKLGIAFIKHQNYSSTDPLFVKLVVPTIFIDDNKLPHN